MTEIRPPPKLISPPAPEYAPRIAANRHEQLTELEQDFERGLKTGKERDIFLLVERIKWMIMTIDQSSQHHEIPVSQNPLPSPRSLSRPATRNSAGHSRPSKLSTDNNQLTGARPSLAGQVQAFKTQE